MEYLPMSDPENHVPLRTQVLAWSVLSLAAAAVASGAAAPPAGVAEPRLEAAAPDRPAEDALWPQWRGPGGLAVAADGGIVRRWSETENVLWKTAIEGRGHSSPVVWGQRIFLTTAIEGEVIPGAKPPIHHFGGQEFKHPSAVAGDRHHTMKVLALDTESGRILWSKTAYAGRVYDDRHQASSYASPTAVADGERVYAYFGSEGVYAYGFDGGLVWKRDIGDIKTVGLGVGSSPVLHGDLLIIQADEDEGKDSFIVALDRRNGSEVWRRARPVQATWTTPLLVEDGGGRTQLLTSGNELFISYDPSIGEEIWRATGLGANAIHAPLVTGGLVIFTSGYPSKVIKAIEIDQSGDLTAGDPFLWTYNKGTAYVPSNLLYDGHVYLMNDGGTLTCLDASTGKVVYEGGRFPERGRFMASPVAVGGMILQVNLDGVGALIKAGPEHEVLATNRLDTQVFATPAIVDGRIYIRGEEHLYAIGTK